MKHTKETIGNKALQLSNSIMPFIDNAHRNEIRNNHAKDIQRALDTYWPDMRDERDRLKEINSEMLEALKGIIKIRRLIEFVDISNAEHEGEAIAITRAILKVESAIAKAETI